MIATIELALVKELVAAGEAGALGYRFATKETYPDQFEQYLLDNRNLRTPACWATFLGIVSGDDRNDDLGFQARTRFAVVLAAQNKRNEEDSRHGDGAVPGSYQLAIDAIRVLSRSMLPGSPDIDLVEPVMVRSARPVARTKVMKDMRIAMMAIELELVFPTSILAEDPAGFDTLHVDWDIPAFGNVAPPLPSATPDASDTIEVPQ
ncbi:phage protein Gp37 [Citromicrobium bathyomarinum]|uniref:phage protein Gp37 n=1 Tax=Citromicrobium bathyomarinum TaxID=72174 RepID=UPI003159EB9B